MKTTSTQSITQYLPRSILYPVFAVGLTSAIVGCSKEESVSSVSPAPVQAAPVETTTYTEPKTEKAKAEDLASTSEAASTTTANGLDCPMGFGWSEGLGQYLLPAATMPTDDTANIPTPDCAFHQWSWETFIWANALDANGTPRFMTMPTPADLLGGGDTSTASEKPMLTLASRSHAADQLNSVIEGAGAIVEADGNMLVAKNGYPVYASVHMNESYFNTAKNNLIIDGGYKNNTGDYFSVGAAVIKATWLRLGNGVSAPEGAFVTQAQVPVLHVVRTKTTAAVVPMKGLYDTVDVALVGMHVVGYTENHPEFLWGTFEHKMNAPMIPDNTFSTSGSSPNDYTFYKANTPFSEVNLPNSSSNNPVLSFDSSTGTFSPATNVVQQNKTGGENQTNGVANIEALNESSQTFLSHLTNKAQATFANYNLIGTVWMLPNSYSLTSGAQDAVGSVVLANSTAETFFQSAKNTPMSAVKNCFTCHNATSYTFASNPLGLQNRKIALSHVLSEGTSYAVPNTIPVVISPASE